MREFLPIHDRPGWIRDLNAMLLSAFCHLAAFIALGLLSVISHDGWRGVKLLVNVGDGFDSPSIDDSQLDNAVTLEVTADDAAAAVDPVRLFDVSTMAATDFAALEALSENAAEASGLDGVALGGKGEADGGLSGASAEFFGIGGYGQTFVYVVDCSGSMSERGKFERAMYELLQSIEQLASDQRYFVIFYSDGAYPMDADEPVLATEDEFARTRRWVSHVEPQGGTNPLPALLFALSLRPDAIYFLSDGKFDPATLRELRSQNRPRSQRIPIHAIAFMERATEGLMRTIARNSGGEYRFVK
jgi:von Willebrand factor type A domain